MGKVVLAVAAALGLSLGVVFPLEAVPGASCSKIRCLASLYLGGAVAGLAYALCVVSRAPDSARRPAAFARALVVATILWIALLIVAMRRLDHLSRPLMFSGSFHSDCPDGQRVDAPCAGRRAVGVVVARAGRGAAQFAGKDAPPRRDRVRAGFRDEPAGAVRPAVIWWIRCDGGCSGSRRPPGDGAIERCVFAMSVDVSHGPPSAPDSVARRSTATRTWRFAREEMKSAIGASNRWTHHFS